MEISPQQISIMGFIISSISAVPGQAAASSAPFFLKEHHGHSAQLNKGVLELTICTNSLLASIEMPHRNDKKK